MRYSTRNVLASRYRSPDAIVLRVKRTHTLDLATHETLCRRFPMEALADSSLTDEHAPPTCPKCLRKDTRFDIPQSGSTVRAPGWGL